jgi:hypothetical protein
MHAWDAPNILFSHRSNCKCGLFEKHGNLEEQSWHSFPVYAMLCFIACSLQPGDSWVGELAVRWHNHYWDQPIFGEGMPPIDPLAQKVGVTVRAFTCLLPWPMGGCCCAMHCFTPACNSTLAALYVAALVKDMDMN